VAEADEGEIRCQALEHLQSSIDNRRIRLALHSCNPRSTVDDVAKEKYAARRVDIFNRQSTIDDLG